MDSNKRSMKVPIPVRRALQKLGHDIRDARLRRRIATAVMAERASISRTTLNKVEKGDPGVSLGNYATVLFVLGLADRLATLADVRTDSVGLELDEERLPQRIRRRKRTGLHLVKVRRGDGHRNPCPRRSGRRGGAGGPRVGARAKGPR